MLIASNTKGDLSIFVYYSPRGNHDLTIGALEPSLLILFSSIFFCLRKRKTVTNPNAKRSNFHVRAGTMALSMLS